MIHELTELAETEEAREQLKMLAVAAVLEPVESIRGNHIKNIDDAVGNLLQKIFTGDNLILLTIGQGNLCKTYSVCKLPKTYAGVERQPHSFYRSRKEI